MRLFLSLLAIVPLLSACGTAHDPFGDENTPGFNEKQAKEYLYQKLVIEEQGWQIWEMADKKQVICVALKPAKGAPKPTFTNDKRLSFNTFYKGVQGGAGFFMYTLDDGSLPYYGFYGEYPYRWISVAQLDGQQIQDINNQQTVLSWEGKEVSFQVDTQPDQFDSAEARTDSGVVDFTGVTRANSRILECQARVYRK
ncbi:MAG: hypothetical protein H6969_03010 [Gammaproteobacteria bacterium]|nr:hypothetical protein [Gammaproteobacteria bacterium]MCP5460067.1 hypothetical protein [Gammaproteobacteria bacterium]